MSKQKKDWFWGQIEEVLDGLPSSVKVVFGFFLTAWLAGVVGDSTTAVVKSVLNGWSLQNWWDVFFIVLFFVFASVAYRLRKQFMPVKVLKQLSQLPPKEALIILVSNDKQLKDHDGLLVLGSTTLSGLSLVDAIQATERSRTGLPNHWSWQQILRAIQPHEQTLKTVSLLGSNNGSFESLELCHRLIKSFFPNVNINVGGIGGDFENLSEMMDLLHDEIEILLQAGFSEESIIVDITGGQKTASCAAAMITLHRDVQFQYVQTSSPNKVIGYDVRYQTQ
jgi:hypothetical protein